MKQQQYVPVALFRLLLHDDDDDLLPFPHYGTHGEHGGRHDIHDDVLTQRLIEDNFALTT